MSARRLVSRTQRPEETPSRRGRQSEAPGVAQSAPLPPYEAPEHPLTVAHQRKLADISSSRDYSKYKKHLEAAVKNITNYTAESNDRLQDAKQSLAKELGKRSAAAAEEESEKNENEERAEQRVAALEDKVNKLTEAAEKALRDLIDYRDEMAQQENMLKTVSDQAISLAVPATTANHRSAAGGGKKRRRRRDENGDSEDEDVDGDADYEDQEMGEDDPDDSTAAAAQANVLSPTELLRKAKAEYVATYAARSKRMRYAENNDYKGFKQVVHDAQHPGPNAPPVPHARTWFPEEDPESSNTPAARRRRLANNADHTNNREDDDDDIQFAGAVSDLKCPLTLQTFKEPYSNKKCKHTFEKAAIIDYHKKNAVPPQDPSQAGRRGRHAPPPKGPKVLECPQHGCEAMLELDDFYDDQIVLRQVRRAAAQAAAEMEEDMDGEEDGDVQEERIEAMEDTTAFLD